MKIGVQIHGTTSHGCWSPTRGEGRWAQNVAAILGAAGHDVLAYGCLDGQNGGWGTCPRIPNVELVDWSKLAGTKRKVDILFDAACWQDKPQPIDYDWLLRGYFSFDSGAINDRWKPNEILVYPYAHVRAGLDHPDNPQRARMHYLTYPVLPLTWWSPFARQDIGPMLAASRDRMFLLWATKAPFGGGGTVLPAAWVDYADEILRWAGEQTAKGRHLVMLGEEYLKPGYSPDVDRRDVPRRIRDTANTSVLNLMPYGHVLAYMRRSSLFLTTPVWGSVAMEAVFEGCCPLVWTTMPPFRDVASRHGILLDADDFDPGYLRRVLDALQNDVPFRERVVAEYQEALIDRTPGTLLSHWLSLTSALGYAP